MPIVAENYHRVLGRDYGYNMAKGISHQCEA